VGEHEGDHGVHLEVGQPDPLDRTQLVVVLGDHVGPQRRPADVDLQDPRMPAQQREVLPRDDLQPPAPAAGHVPRPSGLREHDVEHRVQQLRLPGHVGVQRHRPGAEPVRDPAHRHGAQPVGVRELDRSLDDPVGT
jgi:hypothetical protein